MERPYFCLGMKSNGNDDDAAIDIDYWWWWAVNRLTGGDAPCLTQLAGGADLVQLVLISWQLADSNQQLIATTWWAISILNGMNNNGGRTVLTIRL